MADLPLSNILGGGPPSNILGGVLGSVLYQSAPDTSAYVSPNTTTTKKFLRQTGNGSISAAPDWDTLVAADIPDLDTAKITTGTFAAARMPAYTGDVTSSAGGVANTIANNAVTLAKMATMATNSFLGRDTASTGNVEVLSVATAKTMMSLNNVDNTSDSSKFTNTALTGTPTHGGIEIGYRDIPRVTGGIERGKCYATTSGFTLATGSAAGSTYAVYNNSASAITITQGSGLTLRVQGTTTTGNYSLPARGWVTIWFNSTTEAILL